MARTAGFMRNKLVLNRWSLKRLSTGHLLPVPGNSLHLPARLVGKWVLQKHQSLGSIS